MGQLDARLIKPYQKQPWNISQLTDADYYSNEERMAMLQSLKLQPPCCVERYFARPFLDSIDDPSDILPPNQRYQELCLAFRQKVSNMELENNFARAAKMNQSNPHSISSMCAKHITSELKLAQRRLLNRADSGSGLDLEPPGVVIDRIGFI